MYRSAENKRLFKFLPREGIECINMLVQSDIEPEIESYKCSE